MPSYPYDATLSWQENNRRFHETHSAEGEPVQWNGCWLYPDGATKDRDPRTGGVEPPPQPVELARLKLAYRETVLTRAINEFNDLKSSLLQVGDRPQQAEDALQQLADLQKTVMQYKAARDEAERAYIALDPPEVRMQREQAARQQRRQEFLAEVHGIRV
ncbi:MAG: hypothetical protein KY476_10675 [Planctomycetes bacterium]|nr:hypothetical protein [Planctomycetota bacterium]